MYIIFDIFSVLPFTNSQAVRAHRVAVAIQQTGRNCTKNSRENSDCKKNLCLHAIKQHYSQRVPIIGTVSYTTCVHWVLLRLML